MGRAIWICPRCGETNGGDSGCGSCGRARPDRSGSHAMLAQVLNVNYGIVNNVYVSPVEVVDLREVQDAINGACPEASMPPALPGPRKDPALPQAPHPAVRALNAFSAAALAVLGAGFLAALIYVALL